MNAKWDEADKALWEKICALNLSVVRQAVVQSIDDREYSDEGSRLPASEWAAIAEQAYRRFLFICAKHPSAHVVPNGKVDYFWHKHILHTRQYVDDCQALFGRYLHHLPTPRGQNFAHKNDEWNASQALFKAEFDLPIDGYPQFCTNGGGGGGTTCHNMCKGECGKDWPN